MLEGIIIFVLGFLFGKYTDKIIEFGKKLYNKYIVKNNEINKWDNWTKLENVRNDNVVQQKNYTAHYYSINAPSTGYKYFRLKFVNSGWQLSEIIPAYAREYQPPYTALDGYGKTGESIYNLFDNNTGSKWCQGDYGEGTSVEDALWWVVFKTSSPVAVSGYTFTTANDANGRDPKSWTLYGSNHSRERMTAVGK